MNCFPHLTPLNLNLKQKINMLEGKPIDLSGDVLADCK